MLPDPGAQENKVIGRVGRAATFLDVQWAPVPGLDGLPLTARAELYY